MVRPRLSGLRQNLARHYRAEHRRRNGEAATERIETPERYFDLIADRAGRNGEAATERIETCGESTNAPAPRTGRNGEAATERIETEQADALGQSANRVGMVRPRLSGLRPISSRRSSSVACVSRNGEAATERIETPRRVARMSRPTAPSEW